MSNISMRLTSSDSLIITYNLIQLNIGRYLYPIIFLLGNIGSILNVLILTQRVYLRNSCSCYILASTITNLFVINIVIFFHMLAFGFQIDLTTTSLFFCKFRVYISHVTTLLSRIYIVLACIDRWAMSSTNVRRRAFSQMKVARLLIPLLGIGWCIISLHIPLYHYIVNGRCMIILSSYSMFHNIYNTILSGLFIPILMVIFGFLTIRNIKLSRQRVHVQVPINRLPVNQRIGRVNTRSREYEILIMILVQLGVYIITCLPYPMYLVYSTITMQWAKSNVQLSLDKVYSTIAYVLTNINFSATFYIYVLTTRTFRKDLKRLLRENRLIKICFPIEQEPKAIRTQVAVINQQTITMN